MIPINFSQSLFYKLLKLPSIAQSITLQITISLGCYIQYKIKIGSDLFLRSWSLSIAQHQIFRIGNDCHNYKGVIIGTNSVVTKDISSESLVVRVPAKAIKNGIKKSDYV